MIIDELKKIKIRDADAARLLIYTCARTIMVRFAEWQEIDLIKKGWTVPGRKMKMTEDFKIPLPPVVIGFLRTLPRYKNTTCIFPGLGKAGVMGAN